MKFVLDSNVAIKWVLPEADTPQAIAIRDDFRRGVHELIAPDVLPVEVAHALTRAERRGVIPNSDSKAKLADVLFVGVTLHAYLSLLDRALEISSQARIGVYDCLYVALAEREGCELLTADSRLANSLPGFPIVDLANWP